jgi:hypothetical protein
MKFLISDYSTPWNTEPFYINAALSKINIESKIFDSRSSIYDEFDLFKPDILITHISGVSKDMIHYMLSNKNISLLININNIDTTSLEDFAASLSDKKINAKFFGNSNLELKNGSYIKILESADIFLNSGNAEYSIEKLIFVEKEEDIVELDGTYHYSSWNHKLADKVDFILPVHVLNTLFRNYKEIVFKGRSYIGSQLAFNSIYSGTKVTFDTKDTKDLEKIDDIFKGQKLLSSVKNKHTCLHRLKTLLNSLHIDDKASELTKIIGEIK